jgi:predicted DNA-binding ribbon-helix-helix protein
MKDPYIGPLFEIGLSNELGRICQGIRDIAGTNTAFFVYLTSIPKDRKITYGKLVCDFKPNKTENIGSYLRLAATDLITVATRQHQPRISLHSKS